MAAGSGSWRYSGSGICDWSTSAVMNRYRPVSLPCSLSSSLLPPWVRAISPKRRV